MKLKKKWKKKMSVFALTHKLAYELLPSMDEQIVAADKSWKDLFS